jgi:hypothetical protein
MKFLVCDIAQVTRATILESDGEQDQNIEHLNFTLTQTEIPLHEILPTL